MICADTTFLIDLWRNREVSGHPTVLLLQGSAGERFAVPAHAAGEFLEGAVGVSEERFQEAQVFLGLFDIGEAGLETAKQYARIVSDLRRRGHLQGMSKPDVWMAAWAAEHGASLVTRNHRHFEQISGLRLISY